MDAILIKEMRCFINTGWIRIAPITILVGENSTGKSSFLAAARLACDVNFFSGRLDFNEDPFLLGAYDQIAHVYSGKGGRARSFQLGLQSRSHGLEFLATFEKRGSQPALCSQSLTHKEWSLIVDHEENRDFHGKLRKGDSEEISLAYPEKFEKLLPSTYSPSWRVLMTLFSEGLFGLNPSRKKSQPFAVIEEMFNAYRKAERTTLRPYAFAPVRTKPRRTYDPVQEIASPDGQHVPIALARIFFTNKPGWISLKENLDRFGQISGLFESIDIKTLGSSDSDPFQLRIKISGMPGMPANMVDVGYGVSQILPLIVECVSRPAVPETFLIQQPEVHLHPRAQAELASFFATIVKNSRKRLIIETHSDFLVDRIRTLVREGAILTPEDVAILYFEKSGRAVEIHNIRMDKVGNLLDSPGSYRRFFLEEEKKFLGV